MERDVREDWDQAKVSARRCSCALVCVLDEEDSLSDVWEDWDHAKVSATRVHRGACVCV